MLQARVDWCRATLQLPFFVLLNRQGVKHAGRGSLVGRCMRLQQSDGGGLAFAAAVALIQKQMMCNKQTARNLATEGLVEG